MPKYKVSTTCEIEVEAENHQNALKTAKNTSFDYWTQNLQNCDVAQIDENGKNSLFCHICENNFQKAEFPYPVEGCDADFYYNSENDPFGNNPGWVIAAGYGSKHDMADLKVLEEFGGEHYGGKMICDDCIDKGIADGKITKEPNNSYPYDEED